MIGGRLKSPGSGASQARAVASSARLIPRNDGPVSRFQAWSTDLPTFVPIGDPADERVAAYADVRERDLVGRRREFIAEGDVVVRTLLSARSRMQARSLFLSERALPRLSGLLAGASPDLPVYVAPQPVMSTVAGFPIHRGVLALGMRPSEPALDEALAASGPAALLLVLIGTANHDNMGGVFRNAAAFGVDAVVLDETACDPLYRKALRVSVGASLVVPFTRAGRACDIVDALLAAGVRTLALSPAGDRPIQAVEAQGRTALLLGPEGPGLPDAVLSRASSIRIPMAPGFDSLNLATAAGIALHRLSRHGR